MSRKRTVKKIVLSTLIPIMLFISLSSWGLASPVGASPDDDYHMASIWCGQGIRENLCELGDKPEERRVPVYVNEAAHCYAFQPTNSAACSVDASNTMVNTDRGNFGGVYPPLYYGFMSIFAGEDIAASIIAMRMVNAFLFVVVGSSLFYLLQRSRRPPLVWGALASLIPLGMFLIPSVNPSSWAVLSAATLWVALLGYFEAKSIRKRTAFGVIATVSLVMGAGARSDAAVYGVLAIAVVFVLSWARTKRFALLCLLPASLAVVAAIMFLASGQSSVVTPDAIAEGATRAEVVNLTYSNLILLPQLWAGALGFWGLGWLDTAMPGLVWVTTLAVFAALLFWGLNSMGKRKSLALTMIFGSLIVIPMYILVNDRVLVGSGVQPRYIYPLMIILVGVALLQLKRETIRLNSIQLIVVASVLSMAHAVALHVNIRRYVTGVDVGGLNLDNGREWWWDLPISPMAVWVIASVSLAATLFGVTVYTIRHSQAVLQQGAIGGAAGATNALSESEVVAA
ncbi:DUF2142 domain-containing protein [Cryobacterium sp. N21]|uniref:DUF2142 domain-containing protein n=1 Tax=Cryobacterium sp. N21 TaxID=2048289 RepID=UPI001304CCCB|nr:DUF2142 domain-containing protein [Cryobacterium sp. N21]